MLTYKKKKEEETRLKARFIGRNDKKKKRFEHKPQSKKILSLILTVPHSQIFSQ